MLQVSEIRQNRGPPRKIRPPERKKKNPNSCSTLTVSIHRVKAPVRACGYINPKGFARGDRTIAGTLILTQFNVDALFRFLQAVLPHDFSKDTTYFKVDQLPPFNATILFSDEYGNASYRRLLGLEFVTDGTVYSIQDMLSEQTISYMASDFTPLLAVNHGMIFDPGIAEGAIRYGSPWALLNMVPPSTHALLSPSRSAAD
ncbi:MAG: hypothetical protein EPN47_16025 [Acidobacteria bacterium]|nr:MAG: hypothetical protein EPN47_16025 [Acidobacteriota bacterium]